MKFIYGDKWRDSAIPSLKILLLDAQVPTPHAEIDDCHFRRALKSTKFQESLDT